MKYQKSLIGSAFLALTATSSTAAWSVTLNDALTKGKTQLHWRLRTESVDQKGFVDETSTATTLKTRITYTSGLYYGLALTLEAEDISALGNDEYSNGLVSYGNPVIADPEVTEMNQANIAYTYKLVTARYGRQRIVLDNQRFIGGVGFRQDEQTFDAFTLTSKPKPNISLFYGYVTDVNRIFAEKVATSKAPNGDHDNKSHLLNARYDTGYGSFTGYGYLIDNITVPNWSSDTIGARWAGKVGPFFGYNLEYASQKDAGDSLLNYSADYNLVELVSSIPFGLNRLNLTAGYEILGSDAGKQGFQTFLATLHAFQGWADKFLSTPASGIENAYASIYFSVPVVTTGLIYHTFDPNEGTADLGQEVDLFAETKAGPVTITLKYADYTIDKPTAALKDTKKVWLMAAVTY